MKEYKSIHGFSLLGTTDCAELSATLVEYRHEKTGAPLYYLDRPDKNMTFAIGFRTVPTDDTGVFHILEHSVLCGSEKFPVKDPFTELLKGSLNTFLNALTYGDRTVYPVSSLNKRSFLDLVDVYLDAVLHPLAVKNRNVFLQEGHRLELAEDGSLIRNGIVYNEMRGAYSSPDELASYYEGQLLFPGGCFGHDSGGHPDAIPTLTYEQFTEAHARYYHPTNSILFLDGELDLDATLALIDSYLGEYGMGERFTDIPVGGDVITEPMTVEYPVATEDELTDGARITLMRRFGSHENRAEYLSVALAAEAIADTNAAPLKKRIVESGLCKNFSFYPVSGMKYPTFLTKFIGVKDGCEEELLSLYRSTLDEILSGEIDKEALRAALNSTEFSLREADYGSYPRGIIYMSSVMEDAVCGEHPSKGLKYNDLFTFLHSKLDTPHYVDALRAAIQTGDEAMLILRPSVTAREEVEAKERAALDELLAKMSKEEHEAIRAQSEAFLLWQQTEDSEEALASIPSLSLDDLITTAPRTPTDVYTEGDITVISHPISANGITYLDLLFDASDLSAEDMTALSLMSTCLPDLDTEGYTAAEFRNKIKANIGNISLSCLPIKRDGIAKLYVQVSLSTLETNKAISLEILSEYIYKRKFNDEGIIKRKLAQVKTTLREAFVASPVSATVGRGAAVFDRFESIKEQISGIALLKYVMRAADEIPASELLSKFEQLIYKLLTRSRLTVSVTGEPDLEYIRAAIAAVREGGTVAGECSIPLAEAKNVGIPIPAPVSYAATVTNLITEGESKFHGSHSTLGTILDFELLWNEIRVKGGAYGTGFICRANSGTLGFYSYRDPNPARSVGVYQSIPSAIRGFLASSPDLTKYIIGTVGQMDTVSTPRSEGTRGTVNYLSGKSQDYLDLVRAESICTTADNLAVAADVIERALKSAVTVVAGPREQLALMRLDEIIEI